MADNKPVLYEGMFLMGANAATDLAAAGQHVRDIIERHGGQIEVLRKWDERRLAYAIRGQKRGVYFLAYFKLPGSKVVAIERDCNLSEQITRALLLRAEHVGEVELELARKEPTVAVEAALRTPVPAAAVASPAEAVPEEDIEAIQ